MMGLFAHLQFRTRRGIPLRGAVQSPEAREHAAPGDCFPAPIVDGSFLGSFASHIRGDSE